MKKVCFKCFGRDGVFISSFIINDWSGELPKNLGTVTIEKENWIAIGFDFNVTDGTIYIKLARPE